MPANLTPQYLEADRRYRQATTPEEQLAALEEMMATIPKHKGTEHMRADIRRRMAKVRTEAARKKAAAGGKGPTGHHVPPEGAGQIMLVGPPNAGKSRLLAALSNASPVIAPYPFATRAPLPGMVPFEDVKIQLVDLPPIAPETAEPWLFSMIRQSDGALLVADLSDDDRLAGLEQTLELAGQSRVRLGRRGDGEGVLPSLLIAAASINGNVTFQVSTYSRQSWSRANDARCARNSGLSVISLPEGCPQPRRMISPAEKCSERLVAECR